MKQMVRIIGGQYKGKKLHFPDLPGLRPTPSRVRETLFNWLMHDIRGALCLDAFAGSGALGFEAFSRGALSVTLLEKDPHAFMALYQQATSFHSPKLTLKKIDASIFLKETNDAFDIVFLDPPFAKNYLPDCLEILAHYPVLKHQGLVYLESDYELNLDEALWQLIKLKKAGLVFYSLYQKI